MKAYIYLVTGEENKDILLKNGAVLLSTQKDKNGSLIYILQSFKTDLEFSIPKGQAVKMKSDLYCL